MFQSYFLSCEAKKNNLNFEIQKTHLFLGCFVSKS